MVLGSFQLRPCFWRPRVVENRPSVPGITKKTLASPKPPPHPPTNHQCSTRPLEENLHSDWQLVQRMFTHCRSRGSRGLAQKKSELFIYSQKHVVSYHQNDLPKSLKSRNSGSEVYLSKSQQREKPISPPPGSIPPDFRHMFPSLRPSAQHPEGELRPEKLGVQRPSPVASTPKPKLRSFPPSNGTGESWKIIFRFKGPPCQVPC